MGRLGRVKKILINPRKAMSDWSKRLFLMSLCVIGYFCLLGLNAYIVKSNFILIGVFQELLTLPLLFIQFVLLVFSIIFVIKGNFRIKTYSFWTFLLLLISNSFCLGPLIFKN